jgi:hypothetical protein
MRNSVRLLAISGLSLACAPPPSRPPEFEYARQAAFDGQAIEVQIDDIEAVVAQTRAEATDGIQSVLLLETPRADMNHSPVDYWYTKKDDHVFEIYLAGHADGPCCTQISTLARELEANAALSYQYSTSGLFHFVCDPDAGCGEPAILDEFVVRLRTLEQTPANGSGTLCLGQLFGREANPGVLAKAESDASASASKACELARASGMTVGIWNPAADIPVVVPLRTREGAPITIELPWLLFEMPEDLADHMDLGDVKRAVHELEKERRWARKLIELGEDIGPSPTKVVHEVVYRHVEASASIINLHTQIADQIAAIEQVLAWERNVMELFELDTATYPLAMFSAEQKRELYETSLIYSNTLRDLKLMNEEALVELGGKLEGKVSFAVISPNTRDNPWSKEIEIARRYRREASVAIAWLEQSTPILIDDARPSLIDDFLRGWPASFAGEIYDQMFDEWAESGNGRQARIWAAVETALERDHDFVGGREQLLRSNMFFEVAIRGEHVHVTPHYLLASDYVAVCEPNSGFATFESTLADQNLPKFKAFEVGHGK